MVTKAHTKRPVKMQVAEVSRPLASVKCTCEAWHEVVFDEDGSFIFNNMTGKITQPRDESGNHAMCASRPADERRTIPAKKKKEPSRWTDSLKIKTFIVKDEDIGCLAAHMADQRGSADQWSVQCFLDDIRMCGDTDTVTKGDGEPASVQREVRRIGSSEPTCV